MRDVVQGMLAQRMGDRVGMDERLRIAREVEWRDERDGHVARCWQSVSVGFAPVFLRKLERQDR